ncbi:hypothetical protein INQ41_06670 [Lysobacter ciconiae]|uniref:Uncharacterized protein n=1 Tax=Novilysobacter ciconiae TaxID=2781022 RepID=A0A7S6ZR93_9GAMM|nr:hypothetical protein [Lysobacter ciconiae]QOW18424.1 hypothetical protein INQ41_06670 [Lysobacter ciconiae]
MRAYPMHAHPLLALTMVAALAAPAGVATADPPPASLPALGPEWKALPVSRLETMRGGFQLPSGLQLSFGIERVVLVNGTQVASSRVVIPDLSRITAEQARDLARVREGMVVQIGDGNTFASSGGAGLVSQGAALVIQNASSGQDISALTTIDVGIGSLGAMRSAMANEALQTALQRAPGAP